MTLGLAVLQRRFEGYAALPLAVAGAWVVRGGTSAAVRRWPVMARWAVVPRVAALVLLVGPGLLLLPVGAVAELPAGAADKFPLLRYLRELPSRPGREGVLASWSDGHEIQWMARKPVLSTPFGTDIDPRSMQDEAAFRLESDPAAAEELLRRRQVGWLLLDNPVRAVATLQPFAPGRPVRAIEERSVTAGSQYAFYPELFDLVGSRLYFLDGNSETGGLPGLGGYRLVAESTTPVEVLGHRAQAYKLFEVVPGARLAVRGLAPGTEVAAAVTVKSNVGRLFQWATRAAAGADGEAILRVPYASGRNGMVVAGPYRVQVQGGAAVQVPVPEAQVLAGDVVPVSGVSR
jgi:asparagine N-glycosylation enzyme membrane subunit Stt3